MSTQTIPSPDMGLHTLTQPDIRKVRICPDFWYPVAWSRELKIGKAHATWFAGQPVVLVRGEAGDVFALENRCAHRQVPLHLGVVEDECIRCTYHGWKYNAEGRCVAVPYLEKCSLRPGNVRSYPCREAYGMIFIFPGDVASPNRADFPEIPTASNPEFKTRRLDSIVGCHFTFMHENLMDMNHQFLHRSLMGGIKTTLLDTRVGNDWIEADYTFSRPRGKQPLGEKFILGKRKTSGQESRDVMTILTNYPYQMLRFTTGGSQKPVLDLWNVYVPQDLEQRTNRTFGLMMIKRPSVPGLIELFWPFIVWFTNGIFLQDRRICELEQAAFDRQGADANREIFPLIVSLRKVLTANSVCSDARAEENGSESPS